jgi:heat shock protein HtpX
MAGVRAPTSEAGSATVVTTTSGNVCARCAAATVTAHGAAPWCPRCEWNLDCYEPARRRPEFGWRWFDRWTHRAAYRLTRRQFADLSLRALDRPAAGIARIVTVTASVLLLAGVAVLAAAGVWLILNDFPHITIPFGIAALGLAFALRPRFGRLDRSAEVLSRHHAAALFRLVDEVATAVGAPAPDIIALDERFGAYATSVGLRRRRVLCVGLPLWAVLPPQERVALLGHELGHFVNGDVRRLLLTQPAFTMLGSAADLVRPVGTRTTGISEMVAAVIQAIAARLLFSLHLLLLWTGLRDAQRAEYLADELAATAAGSGAASELLDLLRESDVVEMVVRREARAGNGPEGWCAAVAEARAAGKSRRTLLRQLSIRDEVSLFASHPPSGLRVQMLTDRAWRGAAVALTPSRSEQIDAELAKHYQRAQRNLGLA